MILNLKEVQKLEKKYQNDRISLDALNNMVNIATTSDLDAIKNSIIYLTLVDLGILTNPE